MIYMKLYLIFPQNFCCTRSTQNNLRTIIYLKYEIRIILFMDQNLSSYNLKRITNSLSSSQAKILIKISSVSDFIVFMADILYITQTTFPNPFVSLRRSSSSQFYVQIAGQVQQDVYQQQSLQLIQFFDVDLTKNRTTCLSHQIKGNLLQGDIQQAMIEICNFSFDEMTYIFQRFCEGLANSFYLRINKNQYLKQQPFNHLKQHFKPKNIQIQKINSHCLFIQTSNKNQKQLHLQPLKLDFLTFLKESFQLTASQKKEITLKIRQIMEYIYEEQQRDKQQKLRRVIALKQIVQMCSQSPFKMYMSLAFNEQTNILQIHNYIEFQFQDNAKLNEVKQYIKDDKMEKCFIDEQQNVVESKQMHYSQIKKINQQKYCKDQFSFLYFQQHFKNQSFQYKNQHIQATSIKNNNGGATGSESSNLIKQYLKCGIYDSSVFAQINRLFYRNSVFQMKNQWDGGFKQFLQQLIQHWQIYKEGYMHEVIKFIKINDLKKYMLKQIFIPELATQEQKSSTAKIINYYEYMYPGINNILQNFRKKLNMPTLQQKVKSWMLNNRKNVNFVKLDTLQQKKRLFFRQYLGEEPLNYFDKLLLFFIEEREYKRLKSVQISIRQQSKQKIPLSLYIYDLVKYDLKIKRFQNLLSFMLAQFNRQYKIQNTRGQIQFRNNIHYQRVMQTKCLGCSTFFYEGVNFLEQNKCQTPYKLFPSVTQIKNYQAGIKDYISALLNSGGGVILFDCVAEYKTVMAKGVSMTEKQKQEYQQRLYSLLKFFSPQLKINKEFLVTFIPIIKNPYIYKHTGQLLSYSGEEAIQRPNQYYFDRPYQKGCYVTRIRVNPTEAERIYFWCSIPISESKQTDNDVNVYCSVLQDNTRKQLKPKQILQQIKQRFRSRYVAQKDNKFRKMWGNFNHDCLTPERGQIQQEVVKKYQQISKNTKQFSNLALIITRHSNLKQIQQKLKQNKIKCQLQIPKELSIFKKAKNAIIMYHNKRFEQLLSELKQNKYTFSGRPTLAINVTNYLKLQFLSNELIMSQQQYQTLREWLKGGFEDDQLSIWQYRIPQSNRVQFYIQTESSRSLAYMYFFFISHEFKVTFKNPPQLDQLDKQKKSTRWIKVYGPKNSFVYNGYVGKFTTKLQLIPETYKDLKQIFKQQNTKQREEQKSVQNQNKQQLYDKVNQFEISSEQQIYIPHRIKYKCIKQIELSSWI